MSAESPALRCARICWGLAQSIFGATQNPHVARFERHGLLPIRQVVRIYHVAFIVVRTVSVIGEISLDTENIMRDTVLEAQNRDPLSPGAPWVHALRKST